MTALITATCCYASPLYGPLETGMQEPALMKALKTCNSLQAPSSDAFISRTGLNGFYKTKKPVGGLFFSLHFDYDKSGGLRSVSFYSDTKATADEYDTRLKSLYKRMLTGLSGLYGPPMNLPDWIEKDALPDRQIKYMHMWRIEPGRFLMTGIANQGTSGYMPVFRFSPPSGMPPKSKKDRDKLKTEWASMPEFYEFAKADRLLSDGVFAMSHHKNEAALQHFKNAADIGSPNAYWGMAFLYRQGKDGIDKNPALADEYTKKAALMGFARAAMKFGETWDKACQALGFDEAEAKEWINRNQRAAQAGYASEQYNLGIMYQHGFGVPQDLDLARQWLQKAANQDHTQSQETLKKLPEAPEPAA